MKKIYFLFTLFLIISLNSYNQTWVHSNSLLSNNTIEPAAIETQDGNVYIIGRFKDTITNIQPEMVSYDGWDIFIAKYNSNLKLDWIKQIGGDLDQFFPSFAIAGNTIYITGGYQDTVYFTDTNYIACTGGYDIFLAEFNLNGDFITATNFGSNTDVQIPTDLLVTENKELILTGFYMNSITLNNDTTLSGSGWNTFAAKYKDTILWAKNIISNTNVRILNTKIFDDGYYFNGYFRDSLYLDVQNYKSVNSSNDIFLYKTGFDGSGKWARRTYGSKNDAAGSITNDDVGNLYYTGYYQSNDFTVDSTASTVSADTSYNKNYWDILIHKFNRQGNLIWKKGYGGTGKDWTQNIIEHNKILYVSGYYSDTLQFEEQVLTTNGVEDYAVLLGMFDTDGNMIAVETINGSDSNQDAGTNLQIDNKNNVLVSGYFESSSITIGDSTYINPNAGDKSLWLGKYKPEFKAVVTSQKNISCQGNGDGELTATGYFGIPPYSYEWSNGGLSQSVSGLEPGIYSVTVSDANDSTAITSAEIKEPALLSTGGTATDIVCANQKNGAISIEVTGGSKPYEYRWQGTGSGLHTSDSNQSSLSEGMYTITVTDNKGCTALDTFYITEPESITFNGSVVTPVTPGDSIDGAINLSVQGGNGIPQDFSYQWEGPNGFIADSQNIDSLRGGNYYVTATDTNNCKADTLFVVNDTSQLIAYISYVKNVECKGGSDGEAEVSVINASGAISYTWEDNSGTPVAGDTIITGVPADTYYVTVVDGNNDTAIAWTYIKEPPDSLDAFVYQIKDELCAGDSDGFIDIDATGGILPYYYHWSNNDSTQDLTNLQGGTYSVTITDAYGCQKLLNNITVQGWPALTLDITILEPISCDGDHDGILQANVTGGNSPYSYLWNDEAHQTFSIASSLSEGIYQVTVTDKNGCGISSFRVLEEPEPMVSNISVQNARCNGIQDGQLSPVITGGTPNYNFFWFKNSNFISSDSNLTDLGIGTYSVNIEDRHGCVHKDTAEITQPLPLSIIHETSEVITSCAGDTSGMISIMARGGTPPLTYSITPDTLVTPNTGTLNKVGQDSFRIALTGLPAGEYTIHIDDSNSCGPVSSSLFQITEPPEIQINNIDTTHLNCYGESTGSILVEASGGKGELMYIIQPGDSSNATGNFDLLSADDYTVEVQDTNGCSIFTGTITITQPEPISIDTIAFARPSTSGSSDGSIHVTAAMDTNTLYYSLYNESDSITMNTDGVFNNLQEGTYTVRIKVTDECPPVITDSIELSASSSIMIANNDITLNVYPVPADDYIYIQASSKKDKPVALALINSEGKTIHQMQINANENAVNERIDVSTYPSGIYFIKINGHIIAKEKILIQ